MSDKSHVGMGNCIMCLEPAIILLDKRLRKTLPREQVVPELCNECKEKVKNGYALIKAKNDKEGIQLNGTYVVVLDSFASKLMKDMEEKHIEHFKSERWTLVEAEIFDTMFSNLIEGNKTKEA